MKSMTRTLVPLLIVVTLWNARGATANAQEPSAESRPMPTNIGGMPGSPRGEIYTSPLQTIGIDVGLGSYAIGAAASLIYLAFVYPFQALFGSSKVEPVMPWLLLPIVGPWMAQYTSPVEHKPFWRGVLIADAGLQAGGLVIGLIGYALSGRRPPPSERAGIELKLGAAGCRGLGLTLAVRTF